MILPPNATPSIGWPSREFARVHHHFHRRHRGRDHGSGISLTAATSGLRAFQIDVSPAQLDKAKAYHAKTLARSVEKQKMSQADADAALGRITYVSDMAGAASAEWAVEAATENIELKKKIFQSMKATFGPNAGSWPRTPRASRSPTSPPPSVPTPIA
jgi:hypothetical protein